MHMINRLISDSTYSYELRVTHTPISFFQNVKQVYPFADSMRFTLSITMASITALVTLVTKLFAIYTNE